MLFVFGDCELDTQRYELRRAGAVHPLEPKAFNVLAYLVEHRARVVLKEELLERFWAGEFVTEAALTRCLKVIRRAVEDTGVRQHVIKTLRGRGYRFVAAVEARTAAPALPMTPPAPRPMQRLSGRGYRGDAPVADHLEAPPPAFASMPSMRPSLPSPRVLLVSREAELAHLHQRWAQALQGHRHVVCITGEVGIGKTTLVDAFVAQAAVRAELWIGRGQCIEQYGAGEAYLPLLELLGQLCRTPDGAHLIELLHQQAPSWLLQMPALLPADAFDALQARSSVTPTRMLRELTEALESLTTEQPLLLVLEDLHWSDVSTLDWLAYVARRRAPARLLVLATSRSGEARGRIPLVHMVTQELRVHGQGTELVLGRLSAAEVATYVGQRFEGAAVSAALAQSLHQRTDGNPLFLVAVVDDLIQKGGVGQGTTGWHLPEGLATMVGGIPESLQQLIAQQLERLEPADQGLLEAASVAGMEASAAAIAAALQRDVEEVEEQCAILARQNRFVQTCGTAEWPDGTVATRYRFRHAFYQDVLYERVLAGRRVRLHRQIGARLEAAYGARAGEIAGELAVHFTRGRDAGRAVTYLHAAGENALRRWAYQEAMPQLTQGLEILTALPDTPARARLELAMQTTLGRVLMLTQGYGAPAVEQALVRARALGQQLGETTALLSVQHGLWIVTFARAELRTARTRAEEFFQMVQSQQEPRQLLRAHDALGETLCYRGELLATWYHLEQCLALDELLPHDLFTPPYVGPGRGVLGRVFLAKTLWLLGYPHHALARIQDAQTLARQVANPLSLVLALEYSARLSQLCRDVRAVQEQSAALLTLAREHVLPFWEAWAQTLQGWVMVQQHQSARGIRQMWEGLAACQATGSALDRPWILGLIAEAYGRHGQAEQGLRVLADALALVDTTEERWSEAELHRLQGELCLHHPLPDPQQAETCFHQALAIARRQQAKSWELRAALSLARLWQQQGKRAKAYDVLGPIYGWFTEGFDTADLHEAKALLEALSG